MAGYQPYPEYKDSDVSWLCAIPKSWEIKRLKFTVNLIGEKLDADTSALDYMGLEHIESWSGKRVEDVNASSEGIASRFLPGDVLFGKLRPYLAKVYLAEHEGLVSTEALVLRPTSHVHEGFLRYYIVSRDFVRIVDSSTYGSKMPRASWNYIGNLPMLLPEYEEQQIIARFLDHKTAQIDALIAKKEALLEKLAEKRTALISHAVTKGLNPQAKMKDSGVEWLGQVPAHWDIIGIKQLTVVKRGASPRPIDDPKYFDDDGEYSWVRIADVSASDRYLENTTQNLADLGKSLSVPLEPGALFLSIAGTVGKPIITKIKCCIHDGFVYFPTYSGNTEFLYYIFFCGQPYLGLGKMGTQLNLNTDTVGSIRIGLPPVCEQEEIVAFLDAVTARLDLQAQKVRDAIEKLKEYRSALITQAVTGKIDVRNVEISDAAAIGDAT